jgi:hypothetical protein
MIRLVLFISILVCGLTLPWPVCVAVALVYAFLYEGMELILVGFFLDAYFGYSGAWLPLQAAYSIAFTGMLISMWGLKPLIRTEHAFNLT